MLRAVEYYAGFFDGEGSIGVYRNGQQTWHLRTQLTQNISKLTTVLLTELKELYGGNLAIMRHDIYRNGKAYNWQLNSITAFKFLKAIRPYLVIKAEQADMAMAWYIVSQKISRDKNGRILAMDKNRPIDINASVILKMLKKSDMVDIKNKVTDDVMDSIITLENIQLMIGD